jgi:mono/diheme cytochrome c family protein
MSRLRIILVAIAATLPVVARAQNFSAAEVERGRYLAVAGDCVSCHTNPAGGEPLAGGYAIPSPLGTIYSTNITPSKSFGIGAYTEAQFERAVREGLRADGGHLYPAMPYTAYVKLSDADIRALYAYFMQGVAPVDARAATTRLPFPFNLRWSMALWNALFFNHARFQPNPTRSAEWNRGAYLAEALEHCSACHTPRNFLMAERPDRAYTGAAVGPWYAPNITSDPISGVGGWTAAELTQYLKTGAVHPKSQAAGGMAEAVTNSLQYLTDADLSALVVYIQAIPPIREAGATRPNYAWGGPVHPEATIRGVSDTPSGAVLYSRYCGSCHQPSGAGTRDQANPSLFNNTATGSQRPDNLIAAIVFGVKREVGGREVEMPNFGSASYVQPLSDAQVAAVSNFTLGVFGNPRARVSTHDVATARAGGQPALLLRAPLIIAPIAIAAVLLVFGWAALRAVRRRGDPT